MPVRSRSSKAKAAAKEKAKDKSDTAAAAPTSADATTGAVQNNKRTIVAKLADRDYNLTPEEALLAVHWIRQLLAIFIGILFGVMRLTGSSPILTQILFSFTGPSTVLSLIREIDLDQIAEIGSIQTEGFAPGMALFFLSWIISYTICLPAAA